MQTLTDAVELTGPPMNAGETLEFFKDVLNVGLGATTRRTTMLAIDAVSTLVRRDDPLANTEAVMRSVASGPSDVNDGIQRLSESQSRNELLARFVRFLGDTEKEKAEATGSLLSSITWGLRLGVAGLLKLARMATRAFGAAIRMTWRFTMHVGRFIVRNLLRPLVTGAFSFAVANPVGAAAIVAAGGAGYLLYRFFRGQSEPDVDADFTPDAPMLDRPPTALEEIGDYTKHGPRRPQGGSAGSVEYASTPMSMDGVEARPAPAAKGNAKAAQEAIVATMDEAGMTSPVERAMFLAQLAHESGTFRYMSEIWGPTSAQARYEGRKDLGNVQRGDGFRYRGRGFIQLTGRNNYQRAGKYLGIDLENNPDLASKVDIAAKIALWYWRVERPRIPKMAQAGDIRGVTKAINGGFNGLADREKKFGQYMSAIKAGQFGYKQGTQAPKETEVKSSQAQPAPTPNTDLVVSQPQPDVQEKQKQDLRNQAALTKNPATEPLIINGRIVQVKS